MPTIKQRVYRLLEPDADATGWSRVIDVTITGLIALNVAAFIVSTVDSLHDRAAGWFQSIEVFSVVVFTLEYVLRLWTCTESPLYRHPVWGRLQFARSPLAVIDLLAIAPFYVTIWHADLRVLRVVRLLRLFRVAKLARYSEALRTLGRVISRKREELLSMLLVAGVLLVLSASLLYAAERDAQPEAFSSIPAAMWWSVATLTTVGYGDIYPVTLAGRVMAAMVAVLGIGMFALPAGVLGAAFVEEFGNRRRADRRCPHCGAQLDD